MTRRSRVAGRARTIGNRVTVKSGSRVRIPPSPPNKKDTHPGVLFVLSVMWFEPHELALYDLSAQAHAQSAVGVYVRRRNGGILRNFACPTAK